MRRLVDAQGGTAYVFPCLEITLGSARQIRHHLAAIESENLLIFISQNAVRGVVHALDPALREKLARVRIAAIGERTRAALQSAELPVRLSPTSGAQNSEGLLQHPDLQSLPGRRVYIARGQDGRETLRETLLERGARVEYIEAYQRVVPREFDAQPVIAALQSGGIQFILLTSYQAFENLLQMLGSDAESLLEEGAQLVVPGARIARKIREIHTMRVIEADSASNEDMLAAIGKV